MTEAHSAVSFAVHFGLRIQSGSLSMLVLAHPTGFTMTQPPPAFQPFLDLAPPVWTPGLRSVIIFPPNQHLFERAEIEGSQSDSTLLLPS